MQRKKMDQNVFCTYGALGIGILFGCLYFLFTILNGNDLLMNYGLEDYDISAMLNVADNEIVFHLVKKRFLQILIFILLVCLTTYSCSSFFFCFGFGFYYGIVMSNLIIKYCLSGLLYGLACFFPHYILYFFVINLCGNWYFKKKDRFHNCYKDMNKLVFFGKLFVIFFLLFFSLYWEIRFQKIFLNYFFQHLV